MEEGKLPYPINKMVKKPPYISIAEPLKIIGNFGHGTAILKRPILEGSFYIEYLFKDERKKESKSIYRSSMRVGLCVYTFN